MLLVARSHTYLDGASEGTSNMVSLVLGAVLGTRSNGLDIDIEGLVLACVQ